LDLKTHNLQFAAPLDENEVNGIAKSIAKWTHGKLTEESFRNYVDATHSKTIQSLRGYKGGLASKGGGRLVGSIRIGSINSKKEWVSLGISRSKFYRMNKKI